jgi:hypothetical protein
MAGKKRSKKGKMPRSRGKLGWSVPFAGSLINLSVNPSYAAAKAGQIPTVPVGGLLIVPKVAWLKRLGFSDAEIPAKIAELEKSEIDA